MFLFLPVFTDLVPSFKKNVCLERTAKISWRRRHQFFFLLLFIVSLVFFVHYCLIITSSVPITSLCEWLRLFISKQRRADETDLEMHINEQACVENVARVSLWFKRSIRCRKSCVWVKLRQICDICTHRVNALKQQIALLMGWRVYTAAALWRGTAPLLARVR